MNKTFIPLAILAIISCATPTTQFSGSIGRCMSDNQCLIFAYTASAHTDPLAQTAAALQADCAKIGGSWSNDHTCLPGSGVVCAVQNSSAVSGETVTINTQIVYGTGTSADDAKVNCASHNGVLTQ